MPQLLASRSAYLLKGAIAAHLKPRLMAGTTLAFDSALVPLKRGQWPTMKAAIIAEVTRLAQPKLAADQTLADLPAFLGAFDDEVDAMDQEDEDDDDDDKKKKEAMDKAARDKAAKDRKSAMDKAARDKAARDAKHARDGETDEEREARLAAEDAAEGEKAEKEEKDAKDKAAMDAAIAGAETRFIARMNAIVDAREEVRPIVGTLKLAFDSAADVYAYALKAKGVDVKGVDPSAFKAMVKMLPTVGARPALAMDHAATNTLTAMFPDLARINQS